MTWNRALRLLCRAAAGALLLLLAACGTRQASPLGSHAPLGGGQPAAGGPAPGFGAPIGGGGAAPPPANGGGGRPGGPVQAAAGTFCQSDRTPQDPDLMARWVHKEGKFYNYFVPNDKWQAVETTSGIDISSPTGDADMSFAYLYGAARPASLQQAEQIFTQLGNVTNVNILRISPIIDGPDGQSQTIEFTGHWNVTGADVHGCFEVTLNDSFVYGYTRQANLSVWDSSITTLRLIRDYVTLVNPGG